MNNQLKICVVGLGYVGLPLAVEFGRHEVTVGFDINASRIAELDAGTDTTREVNETELRQSEMLRFTSDSRDIGNANVYIITVPTPIDRNKRPDLGPLRTASEIVGAAICHGDCVIYESTVYPGATEEVCVPILEEVSGLEFNKGFYVGYSPERINPGDKEHRITNILKVTSGSTPEAADFVDELYRKIISVGTYKASSIRVAEAAKVIENTQRDLNIALINELAIIFQRLDIDTLEVLEAAGTKWNFLPFKPGLVGGHCIGVDPYYLTHKAQEIGYHPQVILSGRRINDGMGEYVADRVIKLMMKRKIHVAGARILIMGLAFKENCPDLRNTRVVDIIDNIRQFHADFDVYDPWVNAGEAYEEYGIRVIEYPELNKYDSVIICVAHDNFIKIGVNTIRSFCKADSIIFDVKNIFEKSDVDGRL